MNYVRQLIDATNARWISASGNSPAITLFWCHERARHRIDGHAFNVESSAYGRRQVLQAMALVIVVSVRDSETRKHLMPSSATHRIDCVFKHRR